MIEIFEKKYQNYHESSYEQWMILPHLALMKTTLGNLQTHFINERIYQSNQNSLIGQGRSFLHKRIYPLFGRQALPRKTLLEKIRDTQVPKDVLVGFIIAAVCFPIMILLQFSLCRLLTRNGVNLNNNKQEIIQVYESSSLLPSSVQFLFKAFLINYITFQGPIIEEVVFRHFLFTWIQDLQGSANTTIAKIVRITSGGLLFGVCHLSFTQGWLNVPIFVITTFLGLIFSILRENSGSITSSSVAHITHNTLAMIL